MSRLLRPTLATLLALSGLLVGIGSATAGAARIADPMAGAPEVGACYDLTLKQAGKSAATESTVSCDRRHTLRVVDVDVLPEALTWDSDEDAVWEAVSQACAPTWQTIRSKDPVLTYRTLYAVFWFEPTNAQKDAGSRWFSCEVGLASGTRLLPLPTGDLPAAKKRPADAVARCATAKAFVPCSSRHSWRVAHTFAAKAKGNDDARGDQAGKAASRTCERRVRGTWLWSWRPYPYSDTKVIIACYRKTTR